jgi:hypothetical protein
VGSIIADPSKVVNIFKLQTKKPAMWTATNAKLEELFKLEFEEFGFSYNVPIKKEELLSYLDRQIVRPEIFHETPGLQEVRPRDW